MAKPKRDQLRRAIADSERLRVRYISDKAGGKEITREIRPGELRGKHLWCSDRPHGVNVPHSLRVDRIVSIQHTGKSFRPWPG
jgi:hypothetical protein